MFCLARAFVQAVVLEVDLQVPSLTSGSGTQYRIHYGLYRDRVDLLASAIPTVANDVRSFQIILIVGLDRI